MDGVQAKKETPLSYATRRRREDKKRHAAQEVFATGIVLTRCGLRLATDDYSAVQEEADCELCQAGRGREFGKSISWGYFGSETKPRPWAKSLR